MAKFRNDRVKIVDFLVKANFCPSPDSTVTHCMFFFSILLYREWNCEICRADVDQFSNFMSSDSTIGTFVKSLNGEMLCKDPSLEMDEEEIEACQNFVSTFLPVALKELFAVFDSTEACREYFNAC